MVEDPTTKRHQSRNYVETLEERVALLEEQLRRARSDDQASSKTPHTTQDPAHCRLAGSETSGEGDGTNELSFKVGMLGLRANGDEPHYLGSSSAFAFSRIIHSSLRQSFPGAPSEVSNVLEEDISQSSPCPLPDPELGISLSNAYFENIHPQYPFLHEPTFRLWEKKLIEPFTPIGPLEFDPIPLFFINMVRFLDLCSGGAVGK